MKPKQQFRRKLALILCSIVVLISSFSSCKKSDNGGATADNTDAYFKCKINGTWRYFNYELNANDHPDGNVVHFVVVGGYETSNLNEPGFVIDFTSLEGVNVNTPYTAYPYSDEELYFDYYYQTPNGTINYDGGHGGSEGSSVNLIITSLTDWGVKGTFSGVLINDQTQEVYTITEGSFSAPYN